MWLPVLHFSSLLAGIDLCGWILRRWLIELSSVMRVIFRYYYFFLHGGNEKAKVQCCAMTLYTGLIAVSTYNSTSLLLNFGSDMLTSLHDISGHQCPSYCVLLYHPGHESAYTSCVATRREDMNWESHSFNDKEK